MTTSDPHEAAPPLQPGDPATDVHALAEWLTVPAGTLQRWAQTDQWPRRHTTTVRGRRTLYSMDAARRSYIARRVPRRATGNNPASEVTSCHVGDLSRSDATT